MNHRMTYYFLKVIWVLVCLPLIIGRYNVFGQSNVSGNRNYIDVHIHLWCGGGPDIKAGGTVGPGKQQKRLDNTQKKDWEQAAKILLEQMDKYGVAKAVLMPPPRTTGNVDREEFQGLAEVVKRHPDRFILAGGGDVLNPMIHDYKVSDVTAEVKARFESEAERLIQSGAKVFAEMAALHLSFTSQHVFEEVSPDHPLFLLLADLAAKYNVPIDLHMEAVPQDMSIPAGFDRTSKNNPKILKANIPGLEKLLEHNRNACIVWQHIGWDNTGYMTIELLRRLLNTHSNLYLALRVEERTVDMNGNPIPNRIVDKDWKIRSEWLKFFEDFPDRFVVGTDEFFGTTGKFLGKSTNAPQSFEETWRILNQLSPELATKIGRENAVRIYNIK